MEGNCVGVCVIAAQVNCGTKAWKNDSDTQVKDQGRPEGPMPTSKPYTLFAEAESDKDIE